jgi:hypothetical protein
MSNCYKYTLSLPRSSPSHRPTPPHPTPAPLTHCCIIAAVGCRQSSSRLPVCHLLTAALTLLHFFLHTCPQQPPLLSSSPLPPPLSSLSRSLLFDCRYVLSLSPSSLFHFIFCCDRLCYPRLLLCPCLLCHPRLLHRTAPAFAVALSSRFIVFLSPLPPVRLLIVPIDVVVASQDAKVDLKPLIVAIIPINSKILSLRNNKFCSFSCF